MTISCRWPGYVILYCFIPYCFIPLTLYQAIFAVEVSLAYLVGARYGGFTNSYMTPEQRASLDPNSDEYHFRIMGSKIQVAGWNLYAMVLWLIKGSLAVFYSRLTYAAPLQPLQDPILTVLEPA